VRLPSKIMVDVCIRFILVSSYISHGPSGPSHIIRLKTSDYGLVLNVSHVCLSFTFLT
jgi:hypothetical protein